MPDFCHSSPTVIVRVDLISGRGSAIFTEFTVLQEALVADDRAPHVEDYVCSNDQVDMGSRA
jgi:hypothetical protein